MNPPPTIVHAAADLRREALLAETASDRRTAPSHRNTKGSGLRGVVRGMLAWVAAIVSRIADEFEPIPGPASPIATRPEPRTRA